jgi:RHH-type proline utilization regulon transcriptional repressor/proline dehydrogenase/delta 1-pyrroline-5-carboxylate dehydrogenase
MGLGTWRVKRSSLSPVSPESHPVYEALLPFMSEGHPEREEFFLRSMASDEGAWPHVYGTSSDATGLDVERNVFRYRPAPVTLRAAGFVPIADIIRASLAGARVGSSVSLSLTDPLPEEVVAALRRPGEGFTPLREYVVETEREFVSRVSAKPPARIRLLGSRADALSVAFDGDPTIAIYGHEVTESGRVEMLPFVVEQSVSLTAHRFGALDPRLSELPV